MSGRPAAWLDEVAARHGSLLPDGRVLISMSQAALALEEGRSAGTISYYLSQLGDRVVRSPAGLIVHAGRIASPARRTAREEATARWAGASPAADSTAASSVVGAGLVRTLKALAELTAELAALSEQFFAGAADHDLADSRELREESANSARLAAGFAGTVSSFSSSKKEFQSLSSFTSPRETPRQFADSRDPEPPAPGFTVRLRQLTDLQLPDLLSDTDVHAAIETLKQHCDRCTPRPPDPDKQAMFVLRKHSAQDLTRLAGRIVTQMRSGTKIGSPYGKLVTEALTEALDPDHIPAAASGHSPTATAGAVEDAGVDQDPEAETAVRAMTGAELAELDRYLHEATWKFVSRGVVAKITGNAESMHQARVGGWREYQRARR